jgi:hypothetical protein
MAGTAEKVISLRKNGVEFATVTFAIGATSGTFALATQTDFAPGDVLDFVAASVVDTTLSDLGIALKGELL